MSFPMILQTTIELVDTTEKWCQERAIYLSLMESVKIADGQDTKRDKGAIPQILSELLGLRSIKM